MAEHVDVTGAASSGDPAPDTIQSQHIRRLEKDLWTAFWGPGVALANIDAGNEQQRGEGWNQASTDAPSMGVVSGNPAAYNDATGVTASDPADVNPASPVDFARGDAHDPTASSVNRDHLNAIIRRVNEAISRTGYSTGGTLANIVRKDEVTDWGALRGSNLPNPPGGTETPSTTVGLADDQSRVRDDHFNTLSDEIEYIRANAGPPARWNYGNYSDATVGAWTQENKKTASEDVSWGNDYWTSVGSNWSLSGGDNYKKNLPFSEVRYKFDNWNNFRYWFNQGGNLTVTPYHENGTSGFATWHAIASGRHLLGITKPSEDDGDKSATNVTLLDSGSLHNLGYAGTGNFRVTGTVNRIWAIPEQANYCSVGSNGYYHFGNCPTGTHTTESACNADTSSRGHTTGGNNWRSTETPMVTVQGSTFNTVYGEHDVLSIDDHYEAEIESVNANVATLKRKPRNYFSQELADVNDKTFVMSRWYRAMALKGDSALYGGSRSEGDPEGYVFMDWRIVHSLTDTDHSIIVRCSYDNSMSAMAMYDATITMYYGIRKPNQMLTFVPEGSPAVYVNFSTDEDDSDERERITMS